MVDIQRFCAVWYGFVAIAVLLIFDHVNNVN